MKNPLYISFCAQKGGVGKSTFTMLVASYLQYKLGINVAILDCDSPQFSIVTLREREQSLIKNNKSIEEALLEQCEQLNNTPYPVIKSSPISCIENARTLIDNTKEKEYDIIFFDFTGSVNVDGIIESILQMDCLFISIEADRIVLVSDLPFALQMRDAMASFKKTDNVFLYWNAIDGRVKNEVIAEYDMDISELGLQCMQSRVSKASAFGKDLVDDPTKVFRSTIFPFNKKLLGRTPDNFQSFINEFCKILKLESQLNNGKYNNSNNTNTGTEREIQSPVS